MAPLLRLVDPRFLIFAARKAARNLRDMAEEFQSIRRVDRDATMRQGLVTGLDVRIDNEARIIIHHDNETTGRIFLGSQTYLGRRVELGTQPGEELRIGDYSTINDNTTILGDVTVGCHCLLSCNIFISSGDHHTRIFPAWLIRDQDKWVTAGKGKEELKSKAVQIEDDVWIGWGAVIKRGVYIGRGAVIGANAVVTRNVPPYSIQAGVPSREIFKRLDFRPPEIIEAANPQHLPYFYSGFFVAQSDVIRSLAQGVIWATSRARLVFNRGRFGSLRLRGRLYSDNVPVLIRVRCNGVEFGEAHINASPFELDLSFDPVATESAAEKTPDVLRSYSIIELECRYEKVDSGAFHTGRAPELPRYGISSGELKVQTTAQIDNPASVNMLV